MKVQMVLYFSKDRQTDEESAKRICFYNADRYSTKEVESIIMNKSFEDKKEILDMTFENMEFLAEVMGAVAEGASVKLVEDRMFEADDDTPSDAISITDDKYIN